MTVVIESGSDGYIHHQIPPLTSDEVTGKLAAEARRRNPGVVFQAVVSPPTSPTAEPAQVQPPPTITS